MDASGGGGFRHITVSPVSGSLGAEVAGVDLSGDMDDDVLAEIRQALLDNLVIFFHNQTLDPAGLLRFARRWGDIHLHPFMQGLEDHPEVLEVVKYPHDRMHFGNAWHSDQMFSPAPAMGTMLYAREVPSRGGDTLFTNQYLAYETLSDGLKATLAGLRTVCVGDNFKQDGGQSRKQRYAGRLSMQTKDPGNVQTVSSHPLIRSHPETGRKALYVGGHAQGFEGFGDGESAPLLEYLMRHSTRPEFICRFRWRQGSLAFWDNRCTQHYAVNDFPGETRIMHRVTVCGDVPV